MTHSSTAAALNDVESSPADTLLAWRVVAALLETEPGIEDGGGSNLDLASLSSAVEHPVRVVIALAGIVARLCRDKSSRSDALRAVCDEIMMLTAEMEAESE